MPFDSISSIPATMSSALRVSWRAPHLSNHPLQNSEHIRGELGRSSFRRRNCSSILAPVPKFMVHTRSSRPLLVKLLDQSHWNRVTLSNPDALTMSRISDTYGLSTPYEPYSFSTCTMMIGPPFSIVSEANCLPTSFSNILTRSMK